MYASAFQGHPRRAACGHHEFRDVGKVGPDCSPAADRHAFVVRNETDGLYQRLTGHGDLQGRTKVLERKFVPYTDREHRECPFAERIRGISLLCRKFKGQDIVLETSGNIVGIRIKCNIMVTGQSACEDTLLSTGTL